MRITFIQTGGTIDKASPHTSKGWAFEFGEPATNKFSMASLYNARYCKKVC